MVGYLDGVESIDGEIYCSAGIMDAFLLMSVMADLIESGSLEIKFNPDGKGKPIKIKYFEDLCGVVQK